MEAVADGTTMYMRSSQFGSLPDGSEWIALDLSLGEEHAKGGLALLEEVTGKVQKHD